MMIMFLLSKDTKKGRVEYYNIMNLFVDCFFLVICFEFDEKNGNY